MSDRSSSNPTRRSVVRAYVGLGSNLGDMEATLAGAIAALDRRTGVRVRRVSRLYATEPWGLTDQPEFRNAVAATDMAMMRGSAADAALAFLAILKTIEREAGRRPGVRWGPRSLDLDLLVFGRHRIHVERSAEARSIGAGPPRRGADHPRAGGPPADRWLEVPHRDAYDRLFVLAPLADVAPGLVPPGWTETVKTRRDEVAAAEAAPSVRVVGGWDERARRWRSSPDRLGPA